jgi:hypothetical protein
MMRVHSDVVMILWPSSQHDRHMSVCELVMRHAMQLCDSWGVFITSCNGNRLPFKNQTEANRGNGMKWGGRDIPEFVQ